MDLGLLYIHVHVSIMEVAGKLVVLGVAAPKVANWVKGDGGCLQNGSEGEGGGG